MKFAFALSLLLVVTATMVVADQKGTHDKAPKVVLSWKHSPHPNSSIVGVDRIPTACEDSHQSGGHPSRDWVLYQEEQHQSGGVQWGIFNASDFHPIVMPTATSSGAIGTPLGVFSNVSSTSSSSSMPTMMITTENSANSSVILRAFSLESATAGAVVWTRRISNSPHFATRLAPHGLIVTCTGGGALEGIDGSTGNTLWTATVPTPKDYYIGGISSIDVSGTTVYLLQGNANARVLAYQIPPPGSQDPTKLLWNTSDIASTFSDLRTIVAGHCHASDPTLQNKFPGAFVSNNGADGGVALNASTGATVWAKGCYIEPIRVIRSGLPEAAPVLFGETGAVCYFEPTTGGLLFGVYRGWPLFDGPLLASDSCGAGLCLVNEIMFKAPNGTVSYPNALVLHLPWKSTNSETPSNAAYAVLPARHGWSGVAGFAHSAIVSSATELLGFNF